MDDPNALKSLIIRTNSYKSLLELRKSIRGFYGKYPFSIFVDLRGRIEEKINTFNSPMCDQATIKILKNDGTSVPLKTEECQFAVGNKTRLSDFIFTKYPDADDFVIDVNKVIGTFGVSSSDSGKEEKKNEKGRVSSGGDSQIDVLQNRVEYLIRLMDHMSRTYGEAIPKIVNDVKEITERLDDLYRKILHDEVEH